MLNGVVFATSPGHFRPLLYLYQPRCLFDLTSVIRLSCAHDIRVAETHMSFGAAFQASDIQSKLERERCQRIHGTTSPDVGQRLAVACGVNSKEATGKFSCTCRKPLSRHLLPGTPVQLKGSLQRLRIEALSGSLFRIHALWV